MKKIFSFLTLCLILTFGCVAPSHAQGVLERTIKSISPKELIGTWVTDGKSFLGDDIQGMFNKADLKFAFTSNYLTVSLDMAGSVKESGMSMSLGIAVDSKFTYNRSGQSLKITFAGQKPEVNLYKFQVDPQTASMLKLAGMSEADLKKVMSDEMGKQDWTKAFKEMSTTMQIATLNDTTLVLTDETGQKLTFKKVK